MASAYRVVLTTPSDTEIEITRSFEAPARLVFDAWTKPEHLVRWFGARGWTLEVDELDLRPGGRWRYVMRNQDGAMMAMHGTYMEVSPPHRLVTTESFEAEEFENMGGETVNTLTLEESGNVTTLRQVTRYQSREQRDSALASPMEEGIEQSFGRLDELLRGLM